MNRWIIVAFLSVFIIACSQINRDSREYHMHGKVLRHGITPIENKLPKDLNIPINKAAAKRGQKLYENSCFECHGAKGEGNGPLAVNLDVNPTNLRKTVRDVPHFKLYISVSHWKKNMPGWKNAFSDRELEDLSHYLRSLR